MNLSAKALLHPRSHDEFRPPKRIRIDELVDEEDIDAHEEDDNMDAEEDEQVVDSALSSEEEDDYENDQKILQQAKENKQKKLAAKAAAEAAAAAAVKVTAAQAAAAVLVPIQSPSATDAVAVVEAVDLVEAEILRQAAILVPMLTASPLDFLPRGSPQQAPRMVAKLRQISSHEQMKQLVLERVAEVCYQRELAAHKDDAEHRGPLNEAVTIVYRREAVARAVFLSDQYLWWSDNACAWLMDQTTSRFSMNFLYNEVSQAIGEEEFERLGWDKLAKALQAVRSAASRAKVRTKKQTELVKRHREYIDALANPTHPRNQAVPGPGQENWYTQPLENLLQSIQPNLLRDDQLAIEHCVTLLGCDVGLVRAIARAPDRPDAVADTEMPDAHHAAAVQTSPAQALFYLTHQLRLSAGVERLQKHWSVPENLFFLTLISQCIVTGDNHRLVELFAEAHASRIKVVDERGTFYQFSEHTRLWEKRNADALTLVLVPWANQITKHEVQLASRAYSRTPGSGAFDAAAVGRGSSHLDAQGDLMLAEIVRALNAKAKELSKGSSNSILTPWIRSKLRDDTFESQLDCANPDEFPMRGGKVINMKTWAETRNYNLSVRQREATDLWTFERPVIFQMLALRQHRFANILRWLWPLCGGTKDKLATVIDVYEANQLREFAEQTAEQARQISSLLAAMDPSSEQYQDLHHNERVHWQFAKALDMLRSLSIQFGLMLTGRPERRFYLHWGPTQRGKSHVWNEIMTHILGPLMVTISADFLAASNRPDDINRHTAGMMALVKARVALMDESDKKRVLSCKQAKSRIQSGPWQELLRACHGVKSVATMLFFKMVILSNHMLLLDGDDPAVVGRLLTYEFQTQFDRLSPESLAIKALLDQPSFFDECFTFFVENAARWYTEEQGQTPECVLSQEAKRVLENNTCPLDAFIREECVTAQSEIRKAAATSRKASELLKHQDLSVSQLDLFHTYQEWVRKAMTDEHPTIHLADRTHQSRFISDLRTELREGLLQRGFKREKLPKPDGQRVEHWVGLRLKAAETGAVPQQQVEPSVSLSVVRLMENIV